MLGDIGHNGGCCGGRRGGGGGLEIRRHRGGNADIAGDPQPQAGALDLDFGQAGLVQQKGEFANKRTVAAGEFCELFYRQAGAP